MYTFILIIIQLNKYKFWKLLKLIMLSGKKISHDLSRNELDARLVLFHVLNIFFLKTHKFFDIIFIVKIL